MEDKPRGWAGERDEEFISSHKFKSISLADSVCRGSEIQSGQPTYSAHL